MELSEIMFNRRSIRKYTDKEISEEDIKSILKAGLLAPSSRNLHPVEMIVVRDKAMLDSLSRAKTAGAGMLREASRAIVVIGDHDRSDVWVEDCSIVMTYMLLKATALGLGSLWIANTCFAYPELTAYLRTDAQLVCAVSLGYPDEAPAARPRKSSGDVTEYRS